MMRTTSPAKRESKISEHQEYAQLACYMQPTVMLFGASIVKGLRRYSSVWRSLPRKTINCGIGGDRTENVLWHIENFNIPASAKYIFIHCGTNNLAQDFTNTIAKGIIKCGVAARQPGRTVIITSILPRDLKRTNLREKGYEVNTILRKYCEEEKLLYLEIDGGFVLEDENLDRKLYHTDYLHLSKIGSEKLTDNIVN